MAERGVIHLIEQKKGLSQEMLKLIACITMLIDHVGYTLVYSAYLDARMVDGVDMLGAAMPREAVILYRLYLVCRTIGRIAFPIYCFLLAEGAYYTRNPKKYGLRLLIGAVLAEIPFDLTFFGGFTFAHQSVMVTLLLGFIMLMCMEQVGGIWKYILLVPFYYAAQKLHTDYGGMGVAMIALFAWTRGMQGERIIQIIGMAILCSNRFMVTMGTVRVPLGMCAILALIPIHFYSGRKMTRSKALQWVFYLFYPVHLAILYLIIM